MEFLRYTLIATACLSFFYLSYILLIKKNTNFRGLRLFLLISVIASLLLPLNNFTLQFPEPAKSHNNEEYMQTNHNLETAHPVPQTKEVIRQKSFNEKTLPSPFGTINIVFLLSFIHLTISLILIGRVLLQIASVIITAINSPKQYREEFILVINKKYKNTFSFFGWIFTNPDQTSQKDFEQMLAHERIHVVQNHSFDLMLVELLSAVMWFNPLVRRMRKEMQLLHEYLADEGALNTGIDKLKYQALLVNQVTEERLIRLSSSFNHSLIKKRMIMMNKSKINSGTKLKLLAIVPLMFVLFVGISCVNGQKSESTLAAIAPTKMNVMYLGVDNPVKIAVSGYEASEIEVEVTNGRIEGHAGEYIVKPIRPGSLTIKVMANGEEISSSEFRVKTVPNPAAALKIGDRYIESGEISKSDLLSAEKIVTMMKNFDFDLSFETVEFTVAAVVNGFDAHQITSYSDEITAQQKQEILSKLESGQTVYFQEIKSKGPDGSVRQIGTILFKVR